jgi:hypothetical protein
MDRRVLKNIAQDFDQVPELMAKLMNSPALPISASKKFELAKEVLGKKLTKSVYELAEKEKPHPVWISKLNSDDLEEVNSFEGQPKDYFSNRNDYQEGIFNSDDPHHLVSLKLK